VQTQTTQTNHQNTSPQNNRKYKATQQNKSKQQIQHKHQNTKNNYQVTQQIINKITTLLNQFNKPKINRKHKTTN